MLAPNVSVGQVKQLLLLLMVPEGLALSTAVGVDQGWGNRTAHVELANCPHRLCKKYKQEHQREHQ